MNTSDQLTDIIAYRVKSGDTLNAIIKTYYGTVTSPQKTALIKKIQNENPRVKNPSLIHPNQLLRLDVPRQYCATPKGFPYHSPIQAISEDWFPQLDKHWQTASPEERSLLSQLAPVMLGAAGTKFSMIDTTFKTNSPLLSEMVLNYESYKRGEITKGQYSYRRTQFISRLSNNLGPTNLLLNGTRTPAEVLRISRAQGVAPTQPLTQQMNKMNRLSKIASRGGVALSVVGLGIACHEIASTDSKQKKNEILANATGGLLGGLLYGLAAGVAIALMVTPIGWVAALAIGVGGVAASYAGGIGAKKLYDAYGREIDFASASGVSSICKIGNSNKIYNAQNKFMSDNSLSVL